MPPKQKAKSKIWTVRQTMLELAEALSLVTAQWREVKEQLVERTAMVGQVVNDSVHQRDELTQTIASLQKQLAAKDKELAADARAFAAIDGERIFLWEELDRFRDRLLAHIRWEAMLPEDARVALNTVRAQEFEDKLDEDAEEAP